MFGSGPEGGELGQNLTAARCPRLSPAPRSGHPRQPRASEQRRIHTRTHTIPSELTYTVNEFVPPRVKFLPKAAPLYRALLPFAQTRHFLSAPPVGAHILLGASLRARHRCFLF